MPSKLDRVTDPAIDPAEWLRGAAHAGGPRTKALLLHETPGRVGCVTPPEMLARRPRRGPDQKFIFD